MCYYPSMKVSQKDDKIDELLTRGVDKIYPSREKLEEILRFGKKIRLYQGFDPTGDKLHLGHMVGLRKHRQWQDLGHEVIFLIGDGTGEAGDPTGKKKTREKFFTSEELRENAKGYLEQAKKIVRFDGPNPIKILYNGEWLNKLTKTDILNIAQNFSVQQLIERDMFQERLKTGESINVREFLYPLLQAYDSVAMDVDLELGGSDQTFNMLAGRTLMRAMKGKEKFNLKKDAMALKKRVASLIVTQLHDESSAKAAEEAFSNTFQKKEIPEVMEEIKTKAGEPLSEVLVKNKVLTSKGEWRRLVLGNGVHDLEKNDTITDQNIKITENLTLKIGKKRFVKIII